MPKLKKEVLVGVGALYTAPVGETVPAHLTTPAGNWIHVGYTEGGVSLEYTTEDSVIEVDQEPDPVKVLQTGRTLQVVTTLAQVSAANLVRAFGGGSIATFDPDAVPASGDEYDEYTPPDLGEETNIALLFDGVDEVNRKVRFIIYEARRTGGSTIQFQKREKATIGATWRVLTPTSGGAPFKVRVLQAGQP